MRRSSVKEYTDTMKRRYTGASRTEKGALLDEYVEVSGYHRKSAIRLLAGSNRNGISGRRGRPAVYGVELKDALRSVWEASDRLCGKRLAPFTRELAERLVEHGELSVTEEVMEQLGCVSASTIDRLMRPYKLHGVRKPFSTTKPGSLLKGAIPIRTFAEWVEDRPGFIEVDLVAHCGDTVEGLHLNTLTAVDIATGWVECQAVWGKGQERVGGAIAEVSQILPFPLVGLDVKGGRITQIHHLNRTDDPLPYLIQP